MIEYSYKILENKKIILNNYSLKNINSNSIEKIRKWRNNQISILRQKKNINTDDQKIYFESIIKKETKKNKPEQIILLFCYKNKTLGYGGITNIDWITSRGELAFLLDDRYANKTIDSEKYFPIFINLIKLLAFDILKIRTVWSETFSIRPKYIRQLELNSFVNVGIIKNNLVYKNKIYSSYFHELYNYKIKKFSNIKKNKSKFGNILITSSSKKIPLIRTVIKSANLIDENIKVISGDSNSNVISKYFFDNFWKMPLTLDENYLIIKKKLIKLNIKTIIPTRDSELEFWSKYKTKFKNSGIEIIVNNYKKINVCNDKLKFDEFCRKNKILTPRTKDKLNIKNTKVIIKERFNSSKIITKNIILEKAKYKLGKYRSPFIQEYIKGREISVDIWSSKTKNKNYFITRYRDLIINGESQVTTSFDDEKLNKIVLQIIKKLKLIGPYMLQFIEKNKKYYLIECNPRIGGASTFSINYGLDMILWSLIENYNIERELPINFTNNNQSNKLVRIPLDTYQ